jgi:hypothetical protein
MEPSGTAGMYNLKRKAGMQKIISHVKNEQGSVIVAALMILVLLTIIGIAATHMSTTEISISTNSLLYERAFYTAEAGLEHAKESLKLQFVEFNDVIIRGGGDPKWDFALDGSVDGKPAASDTDYAGGVPWISNANLDGVNYSVAIWNNDDGGSATADNDGLIFVRSVAVGPRGERCSVEVLLEGMASGGPVSGYTAQEGAGSGKTFTSSDADAMTAGELGTQQL